MNYSVSNWTSGTDEEIRTNIEFGWEISYIVATWKTKKKVRE
jgi:hypothetical protein